jgi:hypothetical protein
VAAPMLFTRRNTAVFDSSDMCSGAVDAPLPERRRVDRGTRKGVTIMVNSTHRTFDDENDSTWFVRAICLSFCVCSYISCVVEGGRRTVCRRVALAAVTSSLLWKRVRIQRHHTLLSAAATPTRSPRIVPLLV